MPSERDHDMCIKHTFSQGFFGETTQSWATVALHGVNNALQKSWAELQMTKNPMIPLENFNSSIHP